MLGATLDQYEVWATRLNVSGKNSRVAVEITAPEFSDPAKAEAFWRTLHETATPKEREALAGFTPIENGLRIITPTRSMSEAKRADWVAPYTDLVNQTAEKEGISVRLETSNVEVRAGSGGAEGRDYLNRASSGLGDSARGVVDRAHAQAVDTFRRGLAATDSAVAAKVPKSRPQGLASGIPDRGQRRRVPDQHQPRQAEALPEGRAPAAPDPAGRRAREHRRDVRRSGAPDGAEEGVRRAGPDWRGEGGDDPRRVPLLPGMRGAGVRRLMLPITETRAQRLDGLGGRASRRGAMPLPHLG